MQYYECQGGLQSALTPGIWLPKVRNMHSEEQEWTFACESDKAIADLVKAVEGLQGQGFRLKALDQSAGRVVVNFYTKAGWLDQYRFKFEAVQGGCKAKVYGFSTGFLPMAIPGAPVLNCALSFIAFADGGKVAHSLHVLSKEFGTVHGAQATVEVTRYSLSNPKRLKRKKGGVPQEADAVSTKV
jgi:hypothetical protein